MGGFLFTYLLSAEEKCKMGKGYALKYAML
jgi:hypothetical protein